MRKTVVRRLLGAVLSAVMMLTLMPSTAMGAVLEREWIVEFTDSAAAKSHAESAGGTYLGGPFALLKGNRAALENYPALSFTENSRVEGSGVSAPSDEKASEQYILTHKSWYAQDAWAALENFLSSRAAPITPADCTTVRVAVIDSGIDATHEDLAARVTAGWDAVNRATIGTGMNSDVSADSHGTKVAGLIAAASDNGLGIVGAAWTFPVELIPVRVLNSRNKGTVADVVAAIYWAVDEGNADILNLSFGQTLRSVPSAMQTAVLHAVEQGVIVVAAAGNDGEYYKADDYSYYPAVLDGVLPVGSTAKALGSSYGNYNNYVQRAEFSNMPSYESECGKTFFYTPGEDLLTTSAGNSYEEFSGTSASAALLSGMLAALKSCADATGQPGVENYLSYCKYSYLGGLYYQDYKYMADALVAGYTSGDVRFDFDAHLPRTLRGTVVLSGILNDPACRYRSVSLFFEGQLVGTVARTDGAKQYLSFTMDTTAFEDGYYYSNQIALMGMLEDGTEEEIDHGRGFDIANNSECCVVKITSGGAPLVGAKGWLFRSGTTEEYRTNGQGEIDLSAKDADGSSRLLVVGEGLLVWRSLAPYPAGNRYSFGNDPALLTICCTGEILAAVDGGVIYATMPDGARYEVGTVNGERTELWVDTDSAIDLTVCGEGAILSATVDLSGDDVVWDLDNAGLATVTLTHDGQAPAEGTEGPVRFLGLALGGFGELRFAAEGGSILVSPGEYAVTGYVYWWDGTYYSLYAEVDLGIRQVTEEGLALVLGSGIPVASVAVSPETVIEGKKAVFTVSLSDSCGNPVTGMGCSDDLCSYREKYGNASLYVEEYDAENDMWSQIGQAYLYTVPGSISVEANVLGTRPGQRRVTFSGTDFFMGMADGVTEFAVVPQETRPAATVRISLTDLYGNTLYDLRAATVLADAEGKEIVREAYVSEYGDEAVIKLPIGESYTLAVLAVDYSTVYLTVCQADLTGAADGDEVLIALETDGSWITHTVSRAVEDIDFCVRDLGCVPFEAFPQYVLEGDGDRNYLEALYTSGLGELDLYFDLMPDDFEADNYEYPPVFTMKKQADLWLESVLEVALPNTITLTAKAGADSAVLTPVITDSCGNVMVDAVYVSRYGGMGDDMAVSKPDMVYPVITVTDGAGRQVYSGVAPFAPVTVDGLEEGSYEAVIVWNSSDISMSGGPVSFAVGGGEPSLPASGQKAPTGFKASASGEVISLSWNAPAGGCEGYLLLRDGEELARPDGEELTYLDDTALPGSYHMYTLYALGVGGERSESVTAGVRLGGGVDAEAPVWGNGAQLTVEVGESGLSLSWSRAQDSGSGVSGYVLLCNGEQIAQLFTRRYTVSALQADTEYIFAVQAVDGAGNLSEPLTADPVSVSSGILSVELDYAQNRLGYMLGKTMTVRARATADLDSAAITVDYTLQDGSTGTLTPEVTGGGGLFTAVVTLPDNFVQVDRVAVSCGGDDLAYREVPIFRCASHVEITVDLAEAAALYPSAVLSLYAPSVGYAYSWPVNHMAALITEDVIGASDYRLTLTDSVGHVLWTQTLDLSANQRVVLDGTKVRFLQLAVEEGYEGIGVTLTTDGRLYSGELDEDGVAVWNSGGRFLPVGDRGVLRISELDYSEELTFDRVVNQKTVQPEKLGYEVVTISATVLDTEGKGISGIKVRIEGSNAVKTETTGADGTCVLTVVNRKNDTPYLFMWQQRDDQGRCWASRSVPATGDTAVLRPAPMYDQITIRPVLNTDVDPETVSFTVNGDPAALQDGVLSVENDDWWKTGDRVTVIAEYTADGVTYMGRTGFDLTGKTRTVELNMKKAVMVTVSLSSNGDPMTGTKRYFAVYNTDKERVAAFSTYQPSSTVALMEGDRYTVLANWSGVPEEEDYYSSTRVTVIAAEGVEAALDLSKGFEHGLAWAFLVENGFRRPPSVSVLNNGDVRVTLDLAAYMLKSAKIAHAYNVITLPVGARDISCADEYTFDEETGLLTLSEDLVQLYGFRFEVISFTIPAERIPSEFLLRSLTRYDYEGEEYTRVNNEFELADYLMQVEVPARISASALKSDGLPLVIRLPFAQPDGKLEVYAEDILLAVVPADQQNRVVIHPEYRLGERTLRVVYTSENGLALSKTVAYEATADACPVLQSAKVYMNTWTEEYIGDLVNPEGELYYRTFTSSYILTCRATFACSELVDRVWLCGETESENDRFELFWSEVDQAFVGEGMIGSEAKLFNALWIEFDEKTRSIEETAKDVQGELSVDYELTYTPEETDGSPWSYAADPDLGEEVQQQAISDWEKYVELVNGGLYEMEEEDTIEALDGLFGEDGVWHLPAVTDGEDHLSVRYSNDPETVAAKLASDNAFTVRINGEARKVLVELVYEDGDLYICYYGMGDLFIPAVPETGESAVTAAGKVSETLKDLVDRYWQDGLEVKEKYDEYSWIGEGLWDELFGDDPEDGGDPDNGDPCGDSGGSGGKQTRDQRREQVDEMFDQGWEAATAVAEGISMAGGFYGLESTMYGDFLTQDGGPMHALFELQKQRIHQIDDVLDEMDPDYFGDEGEDPCDDDEDNDPPKDPPKNDPPKKNPTPVYPLIDPSGYLYAGAPGHPAVGVNAYLYYLEEDGETWILWNSEDFGQGPNPYPSEADGYYGWDVLPGKWKVVFEGEGYASAESIVLDVPPPHLDVDVALASTRNPAVADAVIRADGSIYLKFDHLMTVDSVLHNAVTVTLGSEVLTGTLEAVDQTVTALGAKQAALDTNVRAGLEVASVFRFVPDDILLTGMTVEISVDGSVLGYNGLPMMSGWSGRLTVPEGDADMTLLSLERIREDGIYLSIGDSYTLNGEDWQALLGDGFGTEEKRTDIGIEWRSNDESVVLVDETGCITAVGGGIATVIGEYEGHIIGFGISVTRAPITADAAENDVKFCRDLNLVLGKACYMWSAAANFRMEDPMEGDEKYLPVAWRVKEGGEVKAEGTVPEGESSVKIIYTPEVLGTLTGEIDYRKYVFTAGRWTPSGEIHTAERQITVTEVTGLELRTAPRAAAVGEALDLSAMRIDIHLSDGTVSTVGWAKLASYGITMNLTHGDVLTRRDGTLILSHGRTGITLKIDLGLPLLSFRWEDGACTVELLSVREGISVMAACYVDGRMVAVEYLTDEHPAAVLTGDEVKVFFLETGTYIPISEAPVSRPGA